MIMDWLQVGQHSEKKFLFLENWNSRVFDMLSVLLSWTNNRPSHYRIWGRGERSGHSYTAKCKGESSL